MSKLYVYKSRKKAIINIDNLITEIKRVKKIEQEIATSYSKKTIAFENKWHTTNDIISVTQMNVSKTKFKHWNRQTEYERSYGKMAWIGGEILEDFCCCCCCFILCLFLGSYFF